MFRGRPFAVVIITLALLLVPIAAPASAQTSDVVGIDLVPEDGTEFTFDGRTYGGTVSLRWHRNGLSVVEAVGLDGYLSGVREVPLSWPEETLKAQAVAARKMLSRARYSYQRNRNARSSPGNRNPANA